MILVHERKSGVQCGKATLSVLMLVASLAFADGTNLTLTVDGVTYSNVTFGTVTRSWVSIRHSAGVASIPLEKLPPDVQQRFGYDPQKAAEYQRLEQQGANGSQFQQQEITGAFGVTLGTKVDLSRYKKTGEARGGIPLYGFTPKNPIEGFTTYWFQATPKTGIIYCVWAQGHFEGVDWENQHDVCKKRLAVVLDLLRKRYGQEEKGLFDFDPDHAFITRGNRDIMVKCTGLVETTLDLFYTDNDLKEQAEKERIELEGKTINGSGL